MLIEYNPDDYEVESTHTTCSYHKEHPGVPYAGCSCSGSYLLKRKERNLLKGAVPQEPDCPWTGPTIDDDVIVEATKYTVKVISYPEWDLVEGWHWWLNVEKVGVDSWRVLHIGKVLSDKNEWKFMEGDDDRENQEYLSHHRFSLDKALELAREAAPSVRVNGLTAVEAYDRWVSL